MLTSVDDGLRQDRLRALCRRFGIAGLMFFTVKGVLWLLMPALLMHLW